MSKEGDRQSVLRTVKVRTALKGDSSWIQRRAEAQLEQEEKPWIAEARATKPRPAPTSPAATSTSPKPASGGYLIRGVFTKTDTKKPSAPSAFNGSSPSTVFIPKKPSDTYKRIAPHSVRTVSESPATAETTLSLEEQDKRTEAASSILRTSGARQRSYVLSAAKKYECTDKSDSPLSPTTKSSPSFIAKRVEINDDEESTPTDSPDGITLRVPTPQDTVPDPTQQSSPVETKESSPAPDLSVPNSSEDITAAPDEGTGTEASPAVASPVETQELSPAPDLSVPNSSEDITAAPDEGSGTEASPAVASLVLVEAEPDPVPSDHLENDDLFALTESTEVPVDPLPSSTDLLSHDLLSGPDSQSEKTMGTLDELAFDIISIDTSRSTLSTDRPSEEASQSPTEEQPEDTQSPEVLVDPVPSSTDLLSQDLINIESATEQKSDSDALVSTATDTSLIDSFDPLPVETSSTKSSTNIISLLQDSYTSQATEDNPPELLIPTSPAETFERTEVRKYNVSDALEDLSEDILPINADTQSSDKSSDNKPEDLFTTEEEHEDPEEEGADDAEDDRNSPEPSISPWSTWRTSTAPSTETETTEESEAVPQSPPPSIPVERALESASQELSAPATPPESKKSFVYVKEYVNSEVAQHNSHGGGDDYVSSQSSSYSYSSPSRSTMTNCTYCGEVVGTEGKITIEDLNIFCHPGCFKCGVCSKPMGDLLYSMFLHGGMVHCESCYSNVL
ncbi:hypothetical protein AAFF_G00110860 [Aldrovandia affinis]|uniref:LIM zinc-binding domain-containing protein n=1 Tax=Aldrovandia affinis TaxID=143900 RepID=A0AAD7WAL9_9TELE|nr:hypothetical protein AAFF_G00110860 [Aldrovandia affinis]